MRTAFALIECEKKAIFRFQLKGSFFSHKNAFFDVLGFREVRLPFMEESLEEGFGQLKVCPKISHIPILLKRLTLGFPRS